MLNGSKTAVPSPNFGSSRLWRNEPDAFVQMPTPHHYINAFTLGLNRPYRTKKDRNGNDIDTVPPEVGERYVVDGQRIDNRDFGKYWTPKNVQGMSVCFGSGRSGKGTGLIIPALIGGYGGNIVMNDPKGEGAWITAQRRREMNHKAAICDPFGEVNRAYATPAGAKKETVMRYNPLAELDPAALSFSEDISHIGEAITIKGGGGNDNANFFSGAGRDLIDGVIAGIVQSKPLGRATFRMFRETITMSDPAFAKWCAEICTHYPGTLAARKLADMVDLNKTNQSVKRTAKEQTTFLDSEQLLRYMEPAPGEETFSFKELSTGKLDVFLVLPATELVTHSRWLRLMINQSMHAVLHARKKLETPVLFLLDEAGTSIGRLDEIKKAYGISAGLGILIWSFYQDISQIEHDYPDCWETFISNSACIQLMNAKDQKTMDYFSKHLGQKTITVTNTSRSKSRTDSGNPGNMGSTTESESSTTSETGVPVIRPEDIKSMPKEEMIVMFQDNNARLFKVEYFSDARYNGLYRPDPEYQTQFPAPIPAPAPPTFSGEARSSSLSSLVTALAPIAGVVCLIVGLLYFLRLLFLESSWNVFGKAVFFGFLFAVLVALGRNKTQPSRWYINENGHMRQT